ncbi:2-oxoacid:acceptor oxidoreductase family protein [Moorella naiadis]|uniref:2-oxoacid:acceptor oxidoreductase family protein n=1 Tax=Moorella naiadis (nom. illeg.) TaxID=3093670 RepID=UPI003D9C819B
MREIRFHGRYGQPVAALANKVAAAALTRGKYAQVFESFAAYRPGAPLEVTVRVDNEFIRRRSANASSPDVVVVMDNSLLPVTDVTRGLKAGGTIVAAGIDRAALGERGRGFQFVATVTDGDRQQNLLQALEELL